MKNPTVRARRVRAQPPRPLARFWGHDRARRVRRRRGGRLLVVQQWGTDGVRRLVLRRRGQQRNVVRFERRLGQWRELWQRRRFGKRERIEQRRSGRRRRLRQRVRHDDRRRGLLRLLREQPPQRREHLEHRLLRMHLRRCQRHPGRVPDAVREHRLLVLAGCGLSGGRRSLRPLRDQRDRARRWLHALDRVGVQGEPRLRGVRQLRQQLPLTRAADGAAAAGGAYFSEGSVRLSVVLAFLLSSLPLAGCSSTKTGSTSGAPEDGGTTQDGTTSDAPHTDTGAGDAATGTSDAPDDVASDVVSDGSGCGEPGQACCPGESCADGGCCVDEQCFASGQQCRTLAGTCAAGSCGSCGGLGQPCCAVTQSEGCSSQQAVCGGCTESGTMCSTPGPQGTCVACGTDGMNCCYGSWCVGTSLYCHSYLDGGTAEYTCSSACGGPGQPCCQGETCKNGGCCMFSQSFGGFTCVASPTCGCTAGQCTTCGVAGQACCEGQSCQQGSCRGPLDAGTCQTGP